MKSAGKGSVFIGKSRAVIGGKRPMRERQRCTIFKLYNMNSFTFCRQRAGLEVVMKWLQE